MKQFIVICSILFAFSCSTEDPSTALVTGDLRFFELYAPTCERWLEKEFPCAKRDCFTAAAVEISGVDTSSLDSVKVYAWGWVQHFQEIEAQPHGSLGKLLALKFTVKTSGRDKKILKVMVPDEEISLKDQLEAATFPEVLLDEYFLDQNQEVEIKRIRALSDKAKAKYLMYVEKAYLPTEADGL
jgi:hypothetical protein